MGIAAGAVRTPAAVVTEEDRGVAAAIEEDEDLVACGQLSFDPGEDVAGDPAVSALTPDVHEFPGRWLCPAGALPQAEVAVPARFPMMQGLERGGRRSEDDGDPLPGRAHDGEISGVVGKAFVLLEGEIMLLVDDDHPELGQGGEDPGAGCQDHARPAGTCLTPRAQPLPLGEPRVVGVDAGPESFAKTLDELWGQADLRHEDERLATLGHGLGDHLQIDLRFATAGDPFQQRRCKAAESRPQRLHGGVLFGIQCRAGSTLHGGRLGRALPSNDPTPSLQGPQGLPPGPTDRPQFALGDPRGAGRFDPIQ